MTFDPFTASVPYGNELSPPDHGLTGWTVPPYNIRTSDITALPAGTVVVGKIPLRAAVVISAIGLLVVQAGTVLTAGQNVAGFYSASGALQGITADLTADFGATGPYPDLPLGSPFPASVPYVYGAVLFNGAGIAVALGKGDAAAVSNFNLSNASSNFATFGSGLTALPAQMGALSSLSAAIFMAAQ